MESSCKGLSDMDVARALPGQGWPVSACPWNDDGARGVPRSGTRMQGQDLLAPFGATAVRTGDMVDTCTGTWLTHYGLHSGSFRSMVRSSWWQKYTSNRCSASECGRIAITFPANPLAMRK